MLGEILAGLTDTLAAEEVLAVVGRREVRDRIEAAASATRVPVGVLVASRIRHLIDHGGEDVWLDLIAAMSGSSQPGVAAVERILTLTFPEPVPVRARPEAGTHRER